MSIRQVRFLLLAGALGGACSFGPKKGPEPTPPPTIQVDEVLEAINRIVEIENLRDDPLGELPTLARDLEPEVRIMAVRALGRFPFPEHGKTTSDALVGALKDAAPEVRELAAFGLGLRADPASIPHILAHWDDGHAGVKARLVEAAGRYDDLNLQDEVMYATGHPSVEVRIAAARAPGQWSTDSSNAGVVDNRLANLAIKAPAGLLMTRLGWERGMAETGTPEDIRVIWSALYSLSRRKSELGREAFNLWCRAKESVEARIFATRGLGSLVSLGAEELESLYDCLQDEDWRVATEAAMGLANFRGGDTRIALENAIGREAISIHVKLAALESLGYFAEDAIKLRPILEQHLASSNPSVIARSLVSFARLFGDEAMEQLHQKSGNPRAIVRKAAAQSCQFLRPENALPLLDLLARDDDLYVAFAASESYGNFLGHGGRQRALQLLGAQDPGLRLGGVFSLQREPMVEDLAALTACYDRSNGGGLEDEIRMEILGLARMLDDPQAQGLFDRGLQSENSYLRGLTREILLAQTVPENLRDLSPTSPTHTPRASEVPRVARRITNPRVRVKTEVGEMVFKLFPTQAPVHVHNFLTLARAGHYDGLRFHRVVSDFVVQGGDQRGDGNGGQSWRENHEPLRHEFNSLSFVEGSMGMPRNSDPDSGGSQWFVTHRPTPHLDGNYTLFGQMISGADVLARIEERHLILKVTVLGE